MIALTIQISDPDESDIVALGDFIRSRNFDRGRETGEIAVVERGGGADSTDPLSVSLTSKERQAQRDLMDLLREFKRRDWQIPKIEIRDLNRKVFAKRQQAPVMYAKRSGYFELDPKTSMYVATEKAKQELRRLEAVHEEKLSKEIATHMQSGGDRSGEKQIDIEFWTPRFMESRFAKLASASESFFSDLTAEGIDKLDASLTQSEREEALAWIESMIVCNLDMCQTFADLLGGLQDVPKLLDFMVEAAKEEIRLRREMAEPSKI
jgi:hypothetical protein